MDLVISLLQNHKTHVELTSIRPQQFRKLKDVAHCSMSMTKATLHFLYPRFNYQSDPPLWHPRLSSPRVVEKCDSLIIGTRCQPPFLENEWCCSSPPCDIEKVCQPWQAHGVQSLLNIWLNFLNTWHSTTSEHVNYCGDLCRLSEIGSRRKPQTFLPPQWHDPLVPSLQAQPPPWRTWVTGLRSS